MLSGGVEMRDASAVASVFSDYFVNVITQLNSIIPEATVDPLSYINIAIDSTLYNFEPCTPIEISNILQNLKQSKQNKNSIPIKLLIENRDLISIHVCSLINQSMINGVFRTH